MDDDDYLDCDDARHIMRQILFGADDAAGLAKETHAAAGGIRISLTAAAFLLFQRLPPSLLAGATLAKKKATAARLLSYTFAIALLA